MARREWIATVVVAAATAQMSCGAKTSIMQPCEIPVQWSRPAVMLALENTIWTHVRRPGTSAAVANVRNTVLNGLSARLSNEVSTGLIYYPNFALVDVCGIPAEIQLPLAPHRSGRIDDFLTEMRLLMPGDMVAPAHGPHGEPNLHSALTEIGRTFDRIRDQPRMVVLFTYAAPTCNPSVTQEQCAECQHVGFMQDCMTPVFRAEWCRDTNTVRAQIAELASREIRTLVLATNDRGPVLPQRFRDFAEAGGLARNNPDWPYYTLDEPDDFASSAAEAVERLQRCDLPMPVLPTARSRFELTFPPNTTLVPYDEQGVDGWKETTSATGSARLRIYGSWCDRAMRLTEAPTLRTREFLCFSQ